LGSRHLSSSSCLRTTGIRCRTAEREQIAHKLLHQLDREPDGGRLEELADLEGHAHKAHGDPRHAGTAFQQVLSATIPRSLPDFSMADIRIQGS